MFSQFKLTAVYQTGLAAIDRQHQMLIQQIEVVAGLLPGQVASLQAEALETLHQLAVAHFSYEEGELKAIADPNLESHGSAHRRLLSTLSRMVERGRAGRPAGVEDGSFFLSWISAHILGVDMRYVPRMKAGHRGSVESAAVSAIMQPPPTAAALGPVSMLEVNFRLLFEAAPDAMIISNETGKIVLVNTQAERLFQYRRADLEGRNIEVLVPADLRKRHVGHRADYLKAPRARPKDSGLDLQAVRRDGSRFPVEISLSPLQTDDGMLITSAIRDISERRRAQQKDQLLTEIHHRVKNNLQLVSSLLKLHAERMHTSEAREAFEDAEQRVRTIALLHETLHQTRESGCVDFAPYANDLVKSLVRMTLSGVHAEITINNVHLSLDQAVPCGLMLNELVTNALKHAFREPTGELRRISVDARHEANTIVLVVKDSGVGFGDTPPGVRPASLGLQLVRTLVRQLDGSVVFSSDQGARVEIRFPSDQQRSTS